MERTFPEYLSALFQLLGNLRRFPHDYSSCNYDDSHKVHIFPQKDKWLISPQEGFRATRLHEGGIEKKLVNKECLCTVREGKAVWEPLISTCPLLAWYYCWSCCSLLRQHLLPHWRYDFLPRLLLMTLSHPLAYHLCQRQGYNPHLYHHMVTPCQNCWQNSSASDLQFDGPVPMAAGCWRSPAGIVWRAKLLALLKEYRTRPVGSMSG